MSAPNKVIENMLPTVPKTAKAQKSNFLVTNYGLRSNAMMAKQ